MFNYRHKNLWAEICRYHPRKCTKKNAITLWNVQRAIFNILGHYLNSFILPQRPKAVVSDSLQYRWEEQRFHSFQIGGSVWETGRWPRWWNTPRSQTGNTHRWPKLVCMHQQKVTDSRNVKTIHVCPRWVEQASGRSRWSRIEAMASGLLLGGMRWMPSQDLCW